MRSVLICCLALLLMCAHAARAQAAQGVLFKGTMYEANHAYAAAQNDVKGGDVIFHWGDIEREEGVYDWSALDQIIDVYSAQGKPVYLNLTAANNRTDDTPEWVFDKYAVRRISQGYYWGFETKAPAHCPGLQMAGGSEYYELINGEASDNKPLSLSKSYRCGAKDGDILIQSSARAILKNGARYYAQADALADGDCTLHISLIDARGGIIARKDIALEANRQKLAGAVFIIPATGDTRIRYSVSGNADIRLDNLNIVAENTSYYGGYACFPNYFDETFYTHYSAFVREYARKYNGDPRVYGVAAGGFGRWEETTLSPWDNRALEEQWVAYGYTDAKYLRHIMRCMDLYKECFTLTPLYTFAYGYNCNIFKDGAYLDGAAIRYAVELGMSIKHNGLSERLGEWESVNNVNLYHFARYKYHPVISTTYEEGGSCNQLAATGHPHSAFNRALLDGVEEFLVYVNDFKDPYVRSYLYNINSQLGANSVERFYCKLGAYPYVAAAVNGQSVKINKVYNLHMGIFQTRNENAELDYTEIDGVKCVKTNDKQHYIHFNVDDRAQYMGMYGSTLSFTYYDGGADSLSVRLMNAATKRYDIIETIHKTNTGEWKTHQLYWPAFGNKHNSHGIDTFSEIVFSDIKDGADAISYVQLDFVPANEFITYTVAQDAPAGASAPVNGALAQIITLADPQPVSGVEIALQSSTAESTRVLLSVYAVGQDGGETLLNARDYIMAADGDILRVPFETQRECRRLKIVLEPLEGEIGWYLGSAGYNYRAYHYEAEYARLPEAAEFSVNTPFISLKVEESDIVTLEKLVNGAFLPVASGVSEQGLFTFSPQTPGIYRLSPQSAAPTAAGLLVRRVNKLPAYANDTGKHLADVYCGYDAQAEGGGMITYDGKILGARITQSPLSVTVKLPEAVDMRASNNLLLRYMNRTPSPLIKVYWATEASPDFTEANSMIYPVVPNDNVFREYCFNIGGESAWRNNDVIALKIIPAYGFTNTGDIALELVSITNGINQNSAYNEALIVN